MKTKIIAIGAHPDDIEIGCGGTIRNYALQNAEIFFIVATLGEKCRVNGANYELLHEKRKVESINASKYLGAKDIFFLGLPDTNVEHSGITVDSIEKLVTKLNPNFIFTHTKEDCHQDHRNIALSTISACRRKQINILHYEAPSTAQSFSPLIFSDITDAITQKIGAIGIFTSQDDKVFVDQEAIKGLAKYRGYTSGSDYAEGFEVSKYYLKNYNF